PSTSGLMSSFSLGPTRTPREVGPRPTRGLSPSILIPLQISGIVGSGQNSGSARLPLARYCTRARAFHQLALARRRAARFPRGRSRRNASRQLHSPLYSVKIASAGANNHTISLGSQRPGAQRGTAGELPMLFVFGFVLGLVALAFVALLPFFVLLFAGEAALKAIPGGRALRFLLMMFKNLRRNLMRTSLTYLATFVLVVIVTMVWSVLYWVDNFAKEKAKPPKLIVQEKWQANSQMPFAYAESLERGAASP